MLVSEFHKDLTKKKTILTDYLVYTESPIKVELTDSEILNKGEKLGSISHATERCMLEHTSSSIIKNWTGLEGNVSIANRTFIPQVPEYLAIAVITFEGICTLAGTFSNASVFISDKTFEKCRTILSVASL